MTVLARQSDDSLEKMAPELEVVPRWLLFLVFAVFVVTTGCLSINQGATGPPALDVEDRVVVTAGETARVNASIRNVGHLRFSTTFAIGRGLRFEQDQRWPREGVAESQPPQYTWDPPATEITGDIVIDLPADTTPGNYTLDVTACRARIDAGERCERDNVTVTVRMRENDTFRTADESGTGLANETRESTRNTSIERSPNPSGGTNLSVSGCASVSGYRQYCMDWGAGQPLTLNVSAAFGENVTYYPENDTVRYPEMHSMRRGTIYETTPWSEWAEGECRSRAAEAVRRHVVSAIGTEDVGAGAGTIENGSLAIHVGMVKLLDHSGQTGLNVSFDKLVNATPRRVDATLHVDGKTSRCSYPVYASYKIEKPR